MGRRPRTLNGRALPKGVSSFADRHGKLRYRFRRTGQKTLYFDPALAVGSPEWLAQLHEFETGATTLAGSPSRSSRFPAGTLDDLCERYYRSQDFCDQGETSRAKNRAVIEHFRDGRGNRRVAGVTFEHLDAILARTGRKTKRVCANGQTRPAGGKAAAQRLRKQLRRLFEHAVKLRMIPSNPVDLTATVKYRTSGFHTWTEEEIAAYQQRHPIGTKARLALEIMLWTGQRSGDARTFGPGHIRGGRIAYTQQKGGKSLWLPLAPQLAAAIKAMSAVGMKTFLVTDAGEPYTQAGFGNWFRERCDEAELPHCTAHGLRKAITRRMAEGEATNKQMKAVGGWKQDREVEHYSAAAEQERLAAQAFDKLIANHPGTED